MVVSAPICKSKFVYVMTLLVVLGVLESAVAKTRSSFYRSSGRPSWEKSPPKGTCFENDTQNSFECNLVKILDDGLLLIQDLRADGAFAAQPKSDFSVSERRHVESPRTPTVLQGSGPSDPAEDFRTNVFLNLEGI